jgi:ComF family protein
MPLLDFCFPRECPACLAGFESPTLFCPDCEMEMDALESTIGCPRCAVPLPAPEGDCPYCRGRGVPPFARIQSLTLFRGPIKEAVHHAKYEHRWPLMERLADRLMAKRELCPWFDDVDALVPVPLHPTRQRARGFNQAEVLARRLCRGIGGTMTVIAPAIRIRNTETQTQMSSAARRAKNLNNAFMLTDPAAVKGKHLVLVDDVMTTGSTLVSLARTLRPARPARLSAIVLCVGDPRGRGFEVI